MPRFRRSKNQSTGSANYGMPVARDSSASPTSADDV